MSIVVAGTASHLLASSCNAAASARAARTSCRVASDSTENSGSTARPGEAAPSRARNGTTVTHTGTPSFPSTYRCTKHQRGTGTRQQGDRQQGLAHARASLPYSQDSQTSTSPSPYHHNRGSDSKRSHLARKGTHVLYCASESAGRHGTEGNTAHGSAGHLRVQQHINCPNERQAARP